MKLGIICDGSGEQEALRELIKHKALGCSTCLQPLFAGMQPKTTAQQIAKKCETPIGYLQKRAVDRVIVLLDLEDRGECPGGWASTLQAAFQYKFPGIDIQIVIKNRMFENWLLADPDAIGGIKDFQVSEAVRRKVSKSKADNVGDPLELMRKCRTGKMGYNKRSDAVAIIKKADPLRMARNSRSFRRFLRVWGHPAYKGQSLKPAK